jgi:trans-aconitate methyltransferase
MMRFRSDRDFLNGISVRVVTGGRQSTCTATLTLFSDDGVKELRKSSRSARGFHDGTWERFVFDAVPDSENATYYFSVETDSEGDIAFSQVAGEIEFRAHHFDELARVLDPLLFRSSPAQIVAPRFERYLDRHIYWGIALKRYFFLRLVHLCDAIGRLREHYGELERVLSVGCGIAYQEAFVAGRLPQIKLHATDSDPCPINYPMPNLTTGILDLLNGPGAPEYDLVFSIECLEHIADYRTAFRNKASRVAVGGFLYISVPFATRDEQEDEELRQNAWQYFQHVTPGFAFEDLEGLFEENNIEVLHASNMFFCDLVHPLRSLVDLTDHAVLEAGAGHIARLYLQDLSPRRASTHREAEGIRFLGRKRAGSDRAINR